MKTTLYLYNLHPRQFDDISYWEALELKQRESKDLYRELYLNQMRSEEEEIRMHYVFKALRHTERLLDERYD